MREGGGEREETEWLSVLAAAAAAEAEPPQGRQSRPTCVCCGSVSPSSQALPSMSRSAVVEASCLGPGVDWVSSAQARQSTVGINRRQAGCNVRNVMCS